MAAGTAPSSARMCRRAMRRECPFLSCRPSTAPPHNASSTSQRPPATFLVCLAGGEYIMAEMVLVVVAAGYKVLLQSD
jgi:hypothetical protein